MNSRACLFCGMPLSRFRVGGSDDFCSPEHRNHYRHRGIGRLGANPLPATLWQPEVSKPLTRPSLPHAAAPHLLEIRFNLRPNQTVFHTILPGLVACLPTPGILRTCRPGTAPESKPRGSEILLRLPQLAHRRMLRIASTGAALQCGKHAILSTPAKKGLTPRVSLTITFRLPRIAAWRYKGSTLATPHVVWPEVLNRPRVAERASGPRTLAAGKITGPAPSIREFRSRPAMPFAESAAKPISARVASATSTQRQATVPWKQQNPEILHLEIRRTGISPGFVHLKQTSAPSAGTHRLAAARFVPHAINQLLPVEKDQTK